MSNFSFSYSVFKRLVLQTHKNKGLFEKGFKKMIMVLVHALVFIVVCLCLNFQVPTLQAYPSSKKAKAKIYKRQ